MQKQRAEVAERQRETDRQTGQALNRARMLLKDGWEANDTVQLAAALAEADKAAKVAHSGGASAVVQEEADTLLSEAEAKEKQAKENATLLTALLDVSAPHETRRYVRTEAGQVAALAEPSVEEQFAAAFRRWGPGLDVDRAPSEEVLQRLQSQPR